MDNDLLIMLVEAASEGYTISFEPSVFKDCTRVVISKNGVRTVWEEKMHIFGAEKYVMSKIKELMRDIDEFNANLWVPTNL